jgi:Na+/melibiose symporter-like transporter
MSASAERLTTRFKLLFSTGDLSTSIPLAILMFFQLFFLTDVARLRPDYAGWAVGIPRIWDAVNDAGVAAGFSCSLGRCRSG